MKNIKYKISWPPLAIILLCATISYLNYEPNTYLTGWDNLHPEFDLPLNLKRSIFSVWQEYQGLGLLGGMAHAADLIRQTFLFLLSQIIPLKLLRYLWTFLMLTIGPLGTYFFLKNHFLSSKVKEGTVFDRQTKTYAAFLGSIFYLLNLSTVQSFFTPYETFVSFYGFFPWLILTLTSYLQNPSKKTYLSFIIILILATPSFYVETIFIVFCLVIIPIIINHFRHHHLNIKSITTIISSLLALLITQSYWLFPIFFFVITNGNVGSQSHINLISSPETYTRNIDYGNLKDIALLKGFWFNYKDVGSDGKWGLLMNSWNSHLDNPIISLTGYIIFTLTLVGIYFSLKHKFKNTQNILSILTICLFFILGGGLLINNFIPLIGELFRSPFTKLSIPLSFCYSLFFSVGTIVILDLFSYLHTHLTYLATTFTISFSLVLFTAPIFQGQLISPTLRQPIPKEYFELFSFMNSQDPNTRIANFPQHTHWSWNHYRWGYRGSGFLWYGLKQPILDRAFDVWEHTSEEYYEEINSALYSENSTALENLAEKYNITWFVIDKYLYTPGQQTSLFNNELETILKKSTHFSLSKNINDKIIIYKYNSKQKTQNFLSNIDTNTNKPKPIYIPNLRPQTDWEITNQNIHLTLNTTAKELTIPSYTETENIIPVSISYRKNYQLLEIKIAPLLPKINSLELDSTPSYVEFPLPEDETGFILQLDDQFIELQIPSELTFQDDYLFLTTTHLPTKTPTTINLYTNTPLSTTNLIPFLVNQEPKTCYINKTNRHIEKITTQNSITLIGTDVVGCLSLPLEITENLISIGFQYTSPTHTPGQVNITNESFGGLPNAILPSNPDKPFSTTKIYSPGNITKNIQLNLILEANETKSPQEITYSHIILTTHRLLASNSIKIKPTQTTNIKLSSNQKLDITIPFIKSPYTIEETPEKNTFFPEPKNCEPSDSNNIFNKTNNLNSITYTAKNANSCEFINYPNLPHLTSYLISLTTTNHSGLPFTVCLENYSTKRCDIFERLTWNSKQTNHFLIQPIINPNEKPGFTLHLYNQSTGIQKTENSLHKLTTTPFPLNFLKNITTKPEEKPSSENQTFDFQSTHPAEFLYTYSTNNPTDTIINLYQTYSPFWLALFVPENFANLPLLKQIIALPQILYKHPTIATSAHQDEWHNSWKISACPPKCEAFGVAIVYLPQYLQFFGFILLPLLPIILLLHPSRKPKKHEPKRFSLFKRKTHKKTSI